MIVFLRLCQCRFWVSIWVALALPVLNLAVWVALALPVLNLGYLADYSLLR